MWWMTEEDQILAIKRMRDDGREADGKWEFAVIKKILLSWQLYTFVVAWAFVELTCGVNLMRWLGLYAQKVGYSRNDQQILPAIGGFPVSYDLMNNRTFLTWLATRLDLPQCYCR